MAGLVGFGIVILAASAIADRVGYGRLLWVAFFLHATSAVVTIAATPIYGDGSAGNVSAYWVLYVGTFLFAIGNGICEAVINPLAATLYPEDRTHYLNVLHAGWPAGLIIGGLIAYGFASANARISHVPWEILVGLFLVPTLLYGLLLYGVRFPVSEARAAGVSFAKMLREFAAPVLLLLLLLLLHAMVGYVELGTDSWIVNIMQNVIEGQAFLLFIYTSALMFALRFFAGPITHRINPLGLLFVSSLLACAGLMMLGSSSTGFAITRGGDRLRRRQDIPLADHAGCHLRAVSARWSPYPGSRRGRGDAVGRASRWARDRLQAGLLCVAIPRAATFIRLRGIPIVDRAWILDVSEDLGIGRRQGRRHPGGSTGRVDRRRERVPGGAAARFHSRWTSGLEVDGVGAADDGDRLPVVDPLFSFARRVPGGALGAGVSPIRLVGRFVPSSLARPG